ncbi:MAG: insulinase family protein, partial [Gemmatimonadota bacterium]
MGVREGVTIRTLLVFGTLLVLPHGDVAAQGDRGPDQVRSPGLDLPVVEDTLPNGMRVLALRRPGAPTASFVLRFDVGAANEGPGQTGIAHFLEHLLFKGTTTIGTTNLERERVLFAAMDAVQDTL